MRVVAPVGRPAAAAQLIAPADERYFEAYRRGDPITQWPLKKTLQQIPQLRGLKSTADQSQLPEILRRAGANVQEFVADFVSTTALETLDTTESLAGYAGRVHSPKGSTQKYRYLMLARREGNAFSLIEYRTDLQGREEQPHKPIRGVLKSTGFAVTQLYFGPRQQPSSDFRYLGRQKIGGSPAEVVAFAEHVDPVAVMGRFSIGEASIPILVQGVAWIRSSDYQILRMRTDLLAPLPPLARVTTLVVSMQGPSFKIVPQLCGCPERWKSRWALAPACTLIITSIRIIGSSGSSPSSSRIRRV